MSAAFYNGGNNVKNADAFKLHNEDEVTIKATGEVTTVLSVYADGNGRAIVDTTYNGFTKFRADELS